MKTHSVRLTLTSKVDPNPIEVDGDSEEEASKALSRWHSSEFAADVTIEPLSIIDSDSKLLRIFQKLDEEGSDFYVGDGLEKASMDPAVFGGMSIHVRWSAMFDFQIEGDDPELLSKQIEEFTKRTILINGNRVDHVTVELSS